MDSTSQPCEPARPAGRLVVVAGGKGGVGTTAVATGLALLGTERAAHRVCLVDLDLQTGDVPVLLDTGYGRGLAELAGPDRPTRERLEEVLFVHASGLRLLLGPGEGERAEDVDAATTTSTLTLLRSMADLVVVDVGSVLTEAAAVAIRAADRILLVSTPDMLSLHAAERTLRLWERLELRRAEDCEVLLNRVGRRAGVPARVAARVVRAPLAPVTVPLAARSLERSLARADGDLPDGPFAAALKVLGAATQTEPEASPARTGSRSLGWRLRAASSYPQLPAAVVAGTVLLSLGGFRGR